MTDAQRTQITNMRAQGFGYTAIASMVGLSKGSVKAFYRSHGLSGVRAGNHATVGANAEFCASCGKPLVQTPGKKKRRFCCDECRVKWWNSHPEQVKKKALYRFACPSKAIPEITLKKTCAETLGLPEFDEDIFQREIEKIIVVGDDRLDFYFRDGHVVQKVWRSTARRDCWTGKYRKQASEYRRRHPPNRKGITCLTSKIRCGECGANFNRQSWTNAAGERKARWFCSTHKNDKDACAMSHAVDEDIIKSLAADALGLEDFDECAFKERIDHITVTGAGALTIGMKDGDSKVYAFSTKKAGSRGGEKRCAAL